ncbi:hypothetical protein ACRS6B_22845 [Nocardia asteroides]
MRPPHQQGGVALARAWRAEGPVRTPFAETTAPAVTDSTTDWLARARRVGETLASGGHRPGPNRQISRFASTDQYANRTLSRKTAASDALVRTARLAVETVGGPGCSRACELEMRYRDVHGCLFHPLPRAEQTHFTGRVALGQHPIG